MMQTNLQLDLAFNYLENTGTNIFLTGKAGTGKTTFLKKLKETSPKRMIVVAPTGVAAINAGGVTIHSFFQLPFGPYIPGSEMASGQNKSYSHKFSRDKINIIRSMDLLVIDEVSMVRADLLDAISDMLRRYRDRNKPFGGVQLLLIGDLQQLAPVAKEDEWNLLREHYASPFFFDSKALSESDYLCIELTQVYREADDTFVRLLNNIRENRFDENTLHTLNQRYHVCKRWDTLSFYDSDRTLLTSHKRHYGLHKDFIDWKVMLGLLRKKPTSFKDSALAKMLGEATVTYLTGLRAQPRREVLEACYVTLKEGTPIELICARLDEAVRRFGHEDLSTLIVGFRGLKDTPTDNVQLMDLPEHLSQPTVPSVSLEPYAGLA